MTNGKKERIQNKQDGTNDKTKHPNLQKRKKKKKERKERMKKSAKEREKERNLSGTRRQNGRT